MVGLPNEKKNLRLDISHTCNLQRYSESVPLVPLQALVALPTVA